MPHVKKKPQGNMEILLKQKTRPKVNYEWIRKTISEKTNLCPNTVFSRYLKIRANQFHAAKPLAFSLHFLFRRDQNQYSNLTSKIMKIFEKILKT